MKLRFFYIPKPRQYNYKPIFYNPDEEKNKNLPKGTVQLTREAYSKWRKDEQRTKRRTSQSIFISIAVVIILLYFILF